MRENESTWLLALGFVALALAFAVSGCTEGSAMTGDPDAGTVPSDRVALVLEPAESELESVDGSTPSVALRAYTLSASGERTEVMPETWSLSHDRLGTLSDGVFVASGRAGGEVTVSASVQGTLRRLEASASIRVHVSVTLPPPAGMPPSVVDDLLTLPDVDEPFEAAQLEYPLDGARLPNNAMAPVIHWTPREQRGDGYRITLTSTYASVRALAWDDGRTFDASHAIDPAAWRVLADSTRGAELRIQVDRLPEGGTGVVRGTPRAIWLSEDGVFGTLYYWQVRTDPQRSDVLRLDPVSGERRSVFGTSDGSCVGCHALSTDGRRLAASTDARGTAWVTAIVDTASAGQPPPDLTPPLSPAYHFLAYRPDGARILASQARDASGVGSRLFLLDGATGAPITTATGLPEEDAGYPAWSPDGMRVAWMQGGGDGTRGTDAATRIVIADVLGDDALGPATTLHEGATLDTTSPEGGSTDSRPTWSPDSRWLAFAHGTRSVSATDIGAEPPRAALYLAPREGGAAIRLERGMGREGPVDAFWPVFSPFATEEADGTRLYWLAFYSRQAYGNTRAGTRGAGRRQLWVMAIDPARAADGEDPSYPPYWLGGQDVRADDIAALWAPTGCRGRGEDCGASSECCSGVCAPADPSMPDVLTCQPPAVCRRAGESCGEADDCCGSLDCNLGICGYAPPI